VKYFVYIYNYVEEEGGNTLFTFIAMLRRRGEVFLL
jgi:hypothetical protein